MFSFHSSPLRVALLVLDLASVFVLGPLPLSSARAYNYRLPPLWVLSSISPRRLPFPLWIVKLRDRLYSSHWPAFVAFSHLDVGWSGLSGCTFLPCTLNRDPTGKLGRRVCKNVLFSYCLFHQPPFFCSHCINGFVRYGYRDYTHGLITTAIYVLPVLRPDTEDAAIASNCVLNTGAFRDDAEFIHT